MVPNRLILDERISSKAKFYYVYLSSKPDGWEFHTKAIIKEIKEGKDAFYAGLLELETRKYLQRTQERIDGKFGATRYELLLPEDFSDTENTDTVFSDTENPDNNNTYSNKKDLSNKQCNAMQGHFSKNENFSTSEIPNNSTEATKPSLDEFEKVWWLLRNVTPNRSFPVALERFWSDYSKLGNAKRQHFPDWESYLKEWIRGEEKFSPVAQSTVPSQKAVEVPTDAKDKKVKEIPITPLQKQFLNALGDIAKKGIGGLYYEFFLKYVQLECDESGLRKLRTANKGAYLRLKFHFLNDKGETKLGEGALLYEVMKTVCPEQRKFDIVEEKEEWGEYRFVRI